MTQRTAAALTSMLLLAATLFALSLAKTPYVQYSPGPTVDVLGEQDGREIIEVSGHKTYRDDGELRMVTVYVSPPGGISLFTALGGWLSPDREVRPAKVVYPQDQTEEESDQESAVQMVGSQDAAVAAALRELGYAVPEVVEVLAVQKGMPAAGTLEVRDVLVAIGGKKITTAQDAVDAVQAHAAGTPIEFRIRRAGKERTVSITPKEVEGTPRVGIVPGPGFTFPFDVSIGISESIGGPSAGLMFSMAIYDTLTPGSLTGGQDIAGTGEITADGDVGPIGGIEQKIVGARHDGAHLFLVPDENCADALKADAGDMRLMRADTLESALDGVEAWVEDEDATLPSCEDWVREHPDQEAS